jgi:hypothetical protein
MVISYTNFGGVILKIVRVVENLSNPIGHQWRVFTDTASISSIRIDSEGATKYSLFVCYLNHKFSLRITNFNLEPAHVFREDFFKES